MTPHLQRRALELFQELCGLTPAELDHALQERCGGDAALRAEVEALLAADARPDGRIESAGGPERFFASHVARLGPARSAAAGAASLPGSATSYDSPVAFPRFPEMSAAGGELVGNYRILRVLGEGGMGTVYEAEQDRPRRRVALKAIRPGLASPQILRRFEQEAHILGRLQHPGIAQIYEAGTAQVDHSVRAFFAMEFIDGQRLDEYIRERRLELRECLRLFIQACDAVEYAHQMGVIHRDLKPANILVTQQGQPKVLDFGVARSMESDQQLTTMLTGAGQIVGTLPYMSPEQIAGRGEHVDVRTDVYSLGVVLFELLAGQLPFDLVGCALPEAARRIQDQPIPRLGTIDRRLRGELEVIVAKAVDKSPDRRYRSARELAADLQRYLEGEPIEARRDSALYVLRKTMVRYRAAVWSGLAFVLLLTAFGVVAAIQSEHNRRLAIDERNARLDALTALAQANQERRRADQTAHRLRRELSVNNIERGRLLGLTGNMSAAEPLLWREYLAEPGSARAYWALWELYARQPRLASWPSGQEFVYTLAVSPDGRQVATAGRDGSVQVCALETQRRIAALDGPPAPAMSVAFSDDGGLLAACGGSGTVVLWDARDFTRIATLKHGAEQLWGLSISPDGRYVAAAGLTNGLHIWRIADQTLVLEQSVPGGARVVRFAPPGAAPVQLAVASSDGRLDLLSLPQEADSLRTQLVQSFPQISNTAAVAFSPDGRFIAAGGLDRIIRVWRTQDGALETSLRPSNGTIRMLAFAADGRSLVSGGWWFLDRHTCDDWRHQSRYGCSVQAMDVLPDGSVCTADIQTDGAYLRLWEPDLNRCLDQRPAHRERSTCLAVSPDGARVATGGDEGEIVLWNVTTRAEQRRIAANGDPNVLRFLPDGRTLLAGLRSGQLLYVEPEEGAVRVLAEGLSFNGRALAIRPDGAAAVYGRAGGGFRLIRLPDGALLEEFDEGPQEALWACYSPDGVALATVARDAVVRLRDGATLAPCGVLTTASGAQPWSLAFSADGRRLAVGTWARQVEIWDVPAQTRLRALEGHTQLVTSVAFAPQGPGLLAASTSNDGTLRLWDTHELDALATLDAGAGDAYDVAFIPGRNELVSVNADGALCWWSLDYYRRHIEGNETYHRTRRGPSDP